MNLRRNLAPAVCIAAIVIAGVIVYSQWISARPVEVTPPALQVPKVMVSHGKLSAIEIASPDVLRRIIADSLRSPEERAQAIYYLSQSKSWKNVEPLLSLLNDESILVRGRAAAAVRHLLGTDFYYHADDPPAKRKEAIEGIRQYWDSRKQNPREET